MSADDEEIPVAVTVCWVIDGVEVPMCEPQETTISRGALDLLRGNVSPLEERRQRAREAFHDTFAGEMNTTSDALDECIETATRVKITGELIDQLADVTYAGGFETRRALVRAALEALGFEVEQ